MPTGVTRRPVSGRGRPPGRFILRGRRCNRNRPQTAHRLAGEPGRLSGSPSVSALGGSRTLTPEGTGSWDRRGCQLRHQRERLTGFEPATFSLARKRSDQLSYSHMERMTGIEPATCRDEGWQCHPLSLLGESNSDPLRTGEGC